MGKEDRRRANSVARAGGQVKLTYKSSSCFLLLFFCFVPSHRLVRATAGVVPLSFTCVPAAQKSPSALWPCFARGCRGSRTPNSLFFVACFARGCRASRISNSLFCCMLKYTSSWGRLRLLRHTPAVRCLV